MSSIDLVAQARAARTSMRNLAMEGNIITICEKDTFKFLLHGFTYACHTILEKKEEDLFEIKKGRDLYTVDSMISIKEVDIMLTDFTTAIFMLSKDSVINVRVSDMKFPNPVSNWYHDNRGRIWGPKFGL